MIYIGLFVMLSSHFELTSECCGECIMYTFSSIVVLFYTFVIVRKIHMAEI